MSDEPIKYIDLNEFHKLGFIQEINRLVLHPAGLALEISDASRDGNYDTLKVWDYREDPEGIIFDPQGMISQAKIDSVSALQLQHAEGRQALIGGLIQTP